MMRGLSKTVWQLSIEATEGKGKDGKSYPSEVVDFTTSPEEPEPMPWDGKVLCPADAFEILPNEPKRHYDLILTDPPYEVFHNPTRYAPWVAG